MLVPYSWLKEIVPVEKDIEEVAEALTLTGLEVEGIESAFPWLDDAKVVRIGKIKWIDRGKNISLCTLETGKEEVQVVCGAPNVREGMLTAFCPPGTVMPDGKEVKEATLYGATSSGMLASQMELLLEGESSGVFDISSSFKDAKIGQSISELTGISDMVLEIGVTPNRPDCLSILGVARETSAIFSVPIAFKGPNAEGFKKETDFPIEIRDPELCGRYVGAIVKGVKVGPSPGWLQRRLVASGVRPINNIVDITNYVLLELGQPLHAFDLNTLKGPKIVVRTAREGEKVVTLDGKERSLHEGMLLICDEERPVAVAGVMGGLETEVTEKTTDILIESALFTPFSIRRTAKALKLPTEASYRFERGVDPEGQKLAAIRACELVLELSGGNFLGIKDENPVPYSPSKVSFSPKRVNTLLGTDISSKRMSEILKALQFEMIEVSEDKATTIPPSFRQDVKNEEDILEEVARCYGFSKIPTSSPSATLIVERPFSQKAFFDEIKNILLGQGLTEIISYSFMSPRELSHLGLREGDERLKPVRLKNPLAEDQSIMRTNLIAPMLSTISRNQRRRNLDLSLFEIGAVFISRGEGVLPEETTRCAIAITGSRFPLSWAWPNEKVDFFDLKGIIQNLFRMLNCRSLLFEVSERPETYFEEGTQLDFKLNGKTVGNLGLISKRVLNAFDIEDKVFLSDIDMEKVFGTLDRSIEFKPLDKFPSIERDLAVILDDSIRAQECLDFIEKNAPNLLTNFFIFDVYKGKQVPKGKKSVAFRFIYRAKDHTLSEEEVQRVHEPLSRAILDEFKGELRS